MSITPQVIALILGGGAAGSVLTLAKAWLSIKSNVDTREDVGIANLERWRRDADERADQAEKRARMNLDGWILERKRAVYWQTRSMLLEAEMVKNGVQLPKLPEEPPGE